MRRISQLSLALVLHFGCRYDCTVERKANGGGLDVMMADAGVDAADDGSTAEIAEAGDMQPAAEAGLDAASEDAASDCGVSGDLGTGCQTDIDECAGSNACPH